MTADRVGRRRLIAMTLKMMAAAAPAALLLAAGDAGAAGLMQRLLRILGVTVAPGQLKSDEDEAGPGRLWLADAAGGPRRALTAGGGYRWPLFEPGGKAIVALQGAALVRVPVDGGAPKVLSQQPRVDKLVAFDPDHANELLVIARDPAAPFAVLSLADGTLRPLPAPQGKDEQKLLSYAEGEERQYGNGKTRLRLQKETRMAEEGTRKWQNVYLVESGAPPRNVSRCQDVTCHQAALSPDGRSVVFVESAPADR